MSLKPKTQRFHEPKFKEREPMEMDEDFSPVDFEALKSARMKFFDEGASGNPLMAERMKEAGLA
jgi:hypothetical protein